MNNKIIDFIKYKGVVWKIPLASALSWELAEWAGSKHPYLAPLTVILSVQLSLDKSIQFAWQRVLGTIVGVLFTVWITPLIVTDGWSIGLLLFVGALIVTWVKWDHAILVQVALSILLVMYFQSKMPTYSLDRIRDTIIGAVVAIVIHIMLFPPDSVHKARKKMIHFSDHLSNHFKQTAAWINEGCPANKTQALQTKLQSLFQELHQATTELDKAEKGLRYNPFGTQKREALKPLTQQMELLRSGYANLVDMIRVFTKWSESGDFAKENQQVWTRHVSELAKLIQQWKNGLDEPGTSSTTTSEYTPQIKSPDHMQNSLYPAVLYMNAEQVIQDFQRFTK
ncbi:FUSC family protein [Brevibacillus brevis]|uniref:FUSC family protein n=1 Tax=Brevibacillus brevis TaxID=1393 RepID=A0A517I5M0_BREBE|nr:aromatic acid exporter family protein [Brevibacillus brevis]QDS34152.1 FUSC family protein [Brevibacillus brevis]